MHAFTAARRPSLTDERDDVVAILLAAFRDDPAVRALYPTNLDYARHFPGFVRAFGGRAFEQGAVDRDPYGTGAALWFPPGLEPDGDAIAAHLETTIPGRRLAPIAAGMDVQGRMHPEEPHWYLPLMGVEPEAQGMGVGSALLAAGLARADADRLPVYVEATSRRSAAFYARHGFETIVVVRAPDYPEIVGMWRPAR